MGAVRLPFRYSWTGTPRAPEEARDRLLQLVMLRLREVGGPGLDALWPAIEEWQFSGREHDELGPEEVSLVFHEHFGALSAAMLHWTTILLSLAPRSRDEWLAERELLVDPPRPYRHGRPLLVLGDHLGWVEPVGVMTDGGLVEDAALPPGWRVQAEQLRRTGGCCSLCHRTVGKAEQQLREPLEFWQIFDLQYAAPATTLQLFFQRPFRSDEERSTFVLDFAVPRAEQAPEAVVAALDGAATLPRRRARALVALAPSLRALPQIMAACERINADEAWARAEVERAQVRRPEAVGADPVARLVDLIDRRTLAVSAGADPVNDAWLASTDRRAMLSLLERGAEFMLLLFERNLRDPEGDFVVGDYDDKLQVLERRRARLAPEDGAEAVRSVMPRLPPAERWLEQFDPGLVPDEERLSMVVQNLRRVGSPQSWWQRLDLVGACEQSQDSRALLTVLTHAGEVEAVVSAQRAVRQTVNERPVSLSPIAVGPSLKELDGALTQAIRAAIGYFASLEVVEGRLVAALVPWECA